MRRLVVALAALWLASCGSSSVTPTGTGGSTGSAGTAGLAGRGGSTGSAGTFGAAGTTGTAGDAGTTGAAGTNGSAGTSGAAGATGVGGAGGVGGSTGEGGRGGTTGAAGRGGTGGIAGSTGLAGRGGAGGSTAGTTGSAGAGQCPATATATPGEKSESITVGGMTRTFLRHIPTGYTGKTPVPVVIDYHGLGGTGMGQKNATSWASVADSQGFIMVWPDGVGGAWNVGRCCSTAQSENVDDVAFTRAIITTLEKEACVDAKRIYASGCSNGGGMAFKLACDAADVIAAVAPVDFDCVTGAAANPSCGSCAPARPISEIQFRGTSDTAVPFNGGSGPRGTVFPGAQENFTEWGGINMCTGTPQALPDHSACQAYPTCGGGVETALCVVQNGTHCGNYQSFGIVNIAWQMFQSKSLP
jgi:polyhydroxybutyrate depolymerase